ncbi:MAG: protein translocase subunit SecF [Actinomycetota bacterium]
MSGRLRRLYRGETDIDFIGRRKVWFAISGLLLAFCSVALATGQSEATRCGSIWPLRGLSCGIEFKGGVQIQAPIDPDGPLGELSSTDAIAEIRDQVAELGAEEAQIQIVGEGDDRSVIVQTKEIAEEDAQQEFTETVADSVGADIAETDLQTIGSKWGAEITGKALRALVIFLIVILVFISWRFEWKMAVAAILALLHDLAITAGVYSIVNFDVTPSTVIAILTILGYSLYDTVVVFDKVEEKVATLATTGKTTYETAANSAMNEVFMRSLNTSLTTLLPVATLLFVGAGLLGASTLQDLALALFVGILVGTYSSVFVATPVLSVMKEREPRFRNVREKVERDSKRAAARDAAVPAEPAPVTGTATSGVITKTRPSAGSKKARRRRKR